MKRHFLSALVAGTVFGACDQPAPHDTTTQPEPEAVEQTIVVASEAEEGEVAVVEPIQALGDLQAQRGGEGASGEAVANDEAVVDKKLAIKGPQDGRLSGGAKAGLGGLALHGAGMGGGGIGSAIGTVGRGSSGYGRGAGDLGERRARVTPRVQTGSAIVRGYSVRSTTPAPAPDRTGAEEYTNHGTNKFTDPTEDRFSTFSIDVDTGSYTIARRKLNDGDIPPAASVRVEEFVNYFGYNYPKPSEGAFRVSMEAAPSPFATDGKTHLLRVGVQGKTIQSAERKPVHLTFLVDVSGSMQRPDKIGLVKQSLRILTDNLKEGDTVAIATYAGRTEVLLEPTRAKGKIIDAIEGLSAGGSTAMASGLDLAYGLATKNLQRDHENRVIVLSDGDANVGRTGWQDMLKQISTEVAKGVTLSTIGFGMGNYKDSTMEQLANHGNGNYYYVDSQKEALKIFGDQVDGTLQVIAKDVKLQVEFNPEAVRRYRLVGYENRDIADKDFRNDKVDAGEIGAGHTVTALYEIELQDEVPERIATVRVRHKTPHGSDTASEESFAFNRDAVHPSMSTSSKDFQFAAAVAAFAEKLRKSPYADKLTYDWILEVAEGSVKGRSDRREFVNLVKKARRA